MDAHVHEQITGALAELPEADHGTVEIEVRLGHMCYQAPPGIVPAKRVRLPAMHPFVLDKAALTCEFKSETNAGSADRIMGIFGASLGPTAAQTKVIQEDRYRGGIRMRRVAGERQECVLKKRLREILVHEPKGRFDMRITVTVEQPHDPETILKHRTLKDDRTRTLKRRSISTLDAAPDGQLRLDVTTVQGASAAHTIELEYVWGEAPTQWTLERTRRLLDAAHTICQ